MQTAFPSVPAAPGKGVLSVSELLRNVRDVLESRFPLLWVGGELSNLRPAASGHWYFTIKDGGGQVDCVMFRSRAAALDFQPREGDKVELRALVTLYEPRGRFQLTVEAMRPAGLGPLYERFLRLKEKLGKEGLFDEDAKRELPAYPRAIGVVTSLAAAALRDVLTTLARRNPAIPVVVYPVPVQGEGAAAKIAAMLATAGSRAECDVLLLVRGGGSIEDLWQFNEESVARAIRASPVPVIVGVGHETDFTIADFAADRRAPTPTAAAELAAPARAELAAQVAEAARALSREARRRLEYAMQTVDALARRIVHPAERLRAHRQLVAQLASRLAFGFAHGMHAFRARVERLEGSLASLDPAAVLSRGYSLTHDAAGALVRDASRVAQDEQITTTLARGRLVSKVLKKL
jgi:exodeoxyribonuclease VII large subunit